VAHVGFVSAAYWGDVMPFVPIADELVRRGHRVSFVVPEGFHDVLRHHAFELVHLGTDFSPRELAAHGAVMEEADTIRGMRAAIALWVEELTLRPAARILAVLRDVDPDVWVAHNTTAWLVELHATPAGTPLVVGHLFPMMIPSAHQPPPMLPLPGRGGPAVNRLGWRVGRAMTGRMMYDREVNALRRERGLPPARANVAFGWERADRILLLTSERYWPRPADWPTALAYTGFTLWGEVDDPLPADLEAHLAAGEPPVLVTMGTSAAANARDAFAMSAEAIAATGARAVMLVGNERNRDALGARDDTWVFAPIRAVLARCQAVVHTAGHGTTAAALHAGVPQVVLPQGFDQVVHAQRIEQLGVGVRVPWKQRSVEHLAAAIHAVADPLVRTRARDLAAELAEEDGPGVAADHVEAVLAAART
jgi:rhamnosyltransferase subunit B